MTKLKVNGSWTQFTDPLIGRESFETHGALSGDRLFVGSHRHCECFCIRDRYMGQLPEHYWESFAHASYAVFSYLTPIAWYNEDGVWIVPDIKYSVTTSKHQNKIRTALSWMGK